MPRRGRRAWPAGTWVNATGTQVFTAYAGQQAAATAQFLLTEAVAAALAVILVALGGAARSRGVAVLGAAATAAGFGTVIMSLAQCVLGLLLAGAAVPAGTPARQARCSRRSAASTG